MSIVTRENLTKKLLMEQDYGAFIVSNIMTDDPNLGSSPVFAEEVKGIKEREKQWEEIKKAKANDNLCTVFISRKYYFEYMNYQRQKTQKQPTSGKVHQTTDVYICPYEMARDIWLDQITDEDEPENQRLPKDVAKRLSLSVKEVQVGNFNDMDDCVYIVLNIQGREDDIEKVDSVLQARYDSD